jgi:hypothetical protein
MLHPFYCYCFISLAASVNATDEHYAPLVLKVASLLTSVMENKVLKKLIEFSRLFSDLV